MRVLHLDVVHAPAVRVQLAEIHQIERAGQLGLARRHVLRRVRRRVLHVGVLQDRLEAQRHDRDARDLGRILRAVRAEVPGDQQTAARRGQEFTTF
jgi:hypothetical protein